MSVVEPLNKSEEFAWRALTRFIVIAPRLLDDDLQRGAGISLSEYTVLMHLSETPEWRLRVIELASRAYLSGSRMTRLVDKLAADGLVKRCRATEDRRGIEVVLTPRGLSRLVEAYPTHLKSVRTRIIDHLDPSSLDLFGSVIAAVPLAEAEPRNM